MATTAQQLVGTYDLDPHHSTVQFAVRHQQIATFRATFDDVEAVLNAQNGRIALNGQTRVESVSITEPPEFRDHVVRSADFFDADAHPHITFRSTSVELRNDGAATVSGELTIRDTTHTITAHGTYYPVRQDPFGGYRAGLELRATIDRRSWGLSWQMPLPDGADALGWDVEITAELELIKKA